MYFNIPRWSSVLMWNLSTCLCLWRGRPLLGPTSLMQKPLESADELEKCSDAWWERLYCRLVQQYQRHNAHNITAYTHDEASCIMAKVNDLFELVYEECNESIRRALWPSPIFSTRQRLIITTMDLYTTELQYYWIFRKKEEVAGVIRSMVQWPITPKHII